MSIQMRLSQDKIKYDANTLGTLKNWILVEFFCHIFKLRRIASVISRKITLSISKFLSIFDLRSMFLNANNVSRCRDIDSARSTTNVMRLSRIIIRREDTVGWVETLNSAYHDG